MSQLSQPGEIPLGCLRLGWGKSTFRSKTVTMCVTTKRIVVIKKSFIDWKTLGLGIVAGAALRNLLGGIPGNIIGRKITSFAIRHAKRPLSEKEIELLEIIDREIAKGNAFDIPIEYVARARARKPSLIKEGLVLLETKYGVEESFVVVKKSDYETLVDMLSAVGVKVEPMS